MKVIYIRDSKSKGYIRVGLGDGEEKLDFTVSESEYISLGSFLCGDDVEDIEALRACDMRYRAKLYALRILSYGNNSASTLKRKLILKSISPAIAAEVCKEMIGLGYINEDAQLRSLIENEANFKLSGRRKIIPKLIAKGYKKENIELVLEDLISHGIVDFNENKRKLIEKKLTRGAGAAEKRKLLYSYGYSVDDSF